MLRRQGGWLRLVAAVGGGGWRGKSEGKGLRASLGQVYVFVYMCMYLLTREADGTAHGKQA